MVAAALVVAIVCLLVVVLIRKKTAQAVWGIGGVLGMALGIVAALAIEDAKVRPEAVAMAAPGEVAPEVVPASQATGTSRGETHEAMTTTEGETAAAGSAEPTPMPVPTSAIETTAEPEPVPVPLPVPVPMPEPAARPVAEPVPPPPSIPPPPTSAFEERAEMLWRYREEARAVATDRERCRDAEEVAAAWIKIRQITKDDEIYRRGYILTKWLERCRSRIERRKIIGLTYDRVLTRRAFDKKLQKRLRDSGRSPVWVRVTGPTDARLWIQGGGFDKASEKEILDSGLRAELTDLGFLRVTFVHGTERNVHHFEPEREADMVRRELERLGIADPLEL
jgi:hypothetical protein